jgi:GTP cyclohydrolase FolE2
MSFGRLSRTTKSQLILIQAKQISGFETQVEISVSKREQIHHHAAMASRVPAIFQYHSAV